MILSLQISKKTITLQTLVISFSHPLLMNGQAKDTDKVPISADKCR